MATTHAIPDTFAEMQATWGDLGPAVIVAHTGLTVPASSLTLPAVSMTGYVLAAGPPARLVYVSQPAVSVTVSGGNGTYWLALHTDLSTAVSGWTRRAGSHYVWQPNATQPANPANALVLCRLTVTGGVISAVTPLAAVTSPPMSTQNSHAVAITGGSIAVSSAASQIFRVDDIGLTGQTAFYTNLPASGGIALYFGGTAPSSFGGPVYLGGAVTFGDPATTRTNLGLGTMAVQNAASVAISGGTANFSGSLGTQGNLFVTGTSELFNAVGIGSAAVGGQQLTVAGPTTLTGQLSGAGANFSGSLGTQGNFFVTGTTQLGGPTTLTGQLSGAGANFSGSLGTQSNFFVTGTTQLGGNVGIAIAPGAATLTVGGNINAASDVSANNFSATLDAYIGRNIAINTGTGYKPGGGPWEASSSRTLKRELAGIPQALALLCTLVGYTFCWDREPEARLFPGPQYGLIAEDVAQTVPQWIGTAPDGGLTVAARGFEALVVEALKQVVARLERLEAAW